MNLEAVKDKIVVKVLVPKEKITEGGIVLTEDAVKNQEPQIAGIVVSFGKDVSFDTKVGEILLMHRNAGMDMIIDKIIYKVIKDDEVYCALRDDCVDELCIENRECDKECDSCDDIDKELPSICREQCDEPTGKFGPELYSCAGKPFTPGE